MVWYCGGFVLLVKGAGLLVEAEALEPGRGWPLMAGVFAILLGGLKAGFVFCEFCRKNLARIAALKSPRVWQFFRPVFFVFLAAMVMLGAILSRMAHNDYCLLIMVGVLDISISVALLGSSYVFRAWNRSAK